MNNRNNSTKYILIELIAVMFLASAGIFVRRSTLPPINTGLWRMVFSLPFLFLLAKNRIRDISKKDMILAIISGVLMAGDLVFFNMAIVTTSMANTNLLTNMTAFIIVPVSFFLFKEKIPKFYLFGLLISILGVIILVLGKADTSNKMNYVGDLFAVGACLFYSMYILITYKLRDRISSSVILFYSAIGAIVCLIIVSGFTEGLKFPNTRYEVLNILIFALCMQVIGQNLLAYCQGEISVNLSIAITLLQPVLASIYSLIIFNEKMSIQEIIGMIVVIIGVYICKRQYNNVT